MNYRDELALCTYLITVKINGDVRVEVIANSDSEAYEVACRMYGADRVINDAQLKRSYGYR